jgi:hypothetical protein
MPARTAADISAAQRKQWDATLQGEAANVFRLWQTVLRPQGFRLTAEVLNFPNGMSGDAGLTVTWGGVSSMGVTRPAARQPIDRDIGGNRYHLEKSLRRGTCIRRRVLYAGSQGGEGPGPRGSVE